MTVDEQPKASVVEAAEEVVRRLRGVLSVRAEADEGGGIRLVHVLGGPDRSPKVIASDVVSALAAELGLELEPRQVRVAAQQRTESSERPATARLKFEGLTVSVVRNVAEVKVHLEEQGLLYEGIAAGPDTTRRRLELVAEATLRAVEVFLRADGLFVLEGVATCSVGSGEVVVAVVTLTDREEDMLAGASLIRKDHPEAVVRAVLDAVNRPTSWLAAQ